MSRYQVVVIETLATGGRHAWSVVRHVVNHFASAACQRPIRVRARGHERQLACGRRLPADQQCAACRPHITIVEVRRIIQ